jgi:large subunit ribosomal protein L22
VPGPKLNERPVLRTRLEGKARAAEPSATSARAVARYVRTSPYKVREVLDLIRGHQVDRAQEILRFCERDAAILVSKVLASAVANAEHTDQIVSDDLYVSACFADEGPTLKRWRPRARGRATRIRKRTSHITVIVETVGEVTRVGAEG